MTYTYCYLLGFLFFVLTTSFSSYHCPDFVFLCRQKSVGRQTSSFAIFGFSVGLCELQMCLAVCVNYLTISALIPYK